MKNKSLLVRIFAILLVVSFFALVFSAISFGTHSCDHSESCAICAYYDKHANELFVPVLLCALVISIVALFSSLRECVRFLPVFTPVKLKVKLSN
jgi:hypothetical protein